MQSKHQFYKNGPDNQKVADITMDLKRVDVNKMDQWDGNQKDNAIEFINRCEKVFEAFKSEILKSCK
jgi:hypothetical protein